jgi:hypothetical protein
MSQVFHVLGVSFNHIPPSGFIIPDLLYFMGMFVFGEGSRTKERTSSAMAAFPSVRANLIAEKHKNKYFIS